MGHFHGCSVVLVSLEGEEFTIGIGIGVAKEPCPVLLCVQF